MILITKIVYFYIILLVFHDKTPFFWRRIDSRQFMREIHFQGI